MQWLHELGWPDWHGWVEIAVLAVLCHYVFLLFRGTRGAPILTGFVLVFVVAMLLTNLLRLDTLNWMLGRVTVYLALAVLIVFQPEIRQGLAELGKKHIFGAFDSRETIADPITDAVAFLSERRIGALIAVEQLIGMKAVRASGTPMDAVLSMELLATIFFPYTPLHDGGVIINGDRIVAARCMFPLTDRENIDKQFGARHRAAIGLADQTDAVIVVVSEETGKIALCHEGHLRAELAPDQLRAALRNLLTRSNAPGSRGAASMLKTDAPEGKQA